VVESADEQTFVLSSPRDRAAYQQALNPQAPIRFLRLDVALENQRRAAVTIEFATARGNKTVNEMTLQLSYPQHWSEGVLGWVAQHHAEGQDIRNQLNPGQGADLLTELANTGATEAPGA